MCANYDIEALTYVIELDQCTFHNPEGPCRNPKCLTCSMFLNRYDPKGQFGFECYGCLYCGERIEPVFADGNQDEIVVCHRCKKENTFGYDERYGHYYK